VPFLDYDVEMRRVTCSTNAIESVNARYPRAVRARGQFPPSRARWTTRWKPALNALAITFEGRIN
jgi:putative transposase